MNCKMFITRVWLAFRKSGLDYLYRGFFSRILCIPLRSPSVDLKNRGIAEIVRRILMRFKSDLIGSRVIEISSMESD